MPNAASNLIAAGHNFQGALLDATRTVAPIFNGLDGFELEGTSYDSVALVALPTASGFKYLGEGAVASRGAYAKGKVEAARIYTNVEEEKSTTDKHNDDFKVAIGRGEIEDWVTMNLGGRARAEFENVDKQAILGVANDVKGFIGLRDAVDVTLAANVYSMTSSPNADKYVRPGLNVAGTTATTGSRIYLVMMGLNGVCFRFGGPLGMAGFLRFNEVKVERDPYTDPIDGIAKVRKIYTSDAEGYIGLSIFGDSRGTLRTFTQRVLRVAFNVTADVGKTATETVLDRLLNTLPPESRGKMAFVMSNRSRQQVRDSKTANGQVHISVAPGDAAMRTFTSIPDLPDSHRGIPIIESDWIADTDAIVTPA